MTREVEITQSGRGGSIHYREGEHTLTFHWEFAAKHVTALIFGPSAAQWAARVPWAADRQEEVFDSVARDVLRQQLPGGLYSVDLQTGTIEISAVRGSERASRVKAPLVSPNHVRVVPERDPREALHDPLSVDVRLGAAEKLLAADASFDIETVLAREIRNLHRPADGLQRALRLAGAHDSYRIRQALLWASWNQTECAPHCAALLLRLTGGAAAEQAAADEGITQRLGLHNSSFTRTDAFEELCRRTSMVIDHDAA